MTSICHGSQQQTHTVPTLQAWQLLHYRHGLPEHLSYCCPQQVQRLHDKTCKQNYNLTMPSVWQAAMANAETRAINKVTAPALQKGLLSHTLSAQEAVA